MNVCGASAFLRLLFGAGDGRCALELFQSDTGTRTYVTEDVALLHTMAFSMIIRCVKNGGHQGSIARGLGALFSSLSFFCLASTFTLFCST